MILDSNAIIYLCNGKIVNESFLNEPLSASCISRLEVLGFHRISELEKAKMEKFFQGIIVFDLTESIILEGIRLRQLRNISIGDAIIAATAIVNDLPLLTANTDDFKWIDGLELINPLG